MRNKEILKLIIGFRHFRERYFRGEDSLYLNKLSQGQNPKTLIIGCSDSRVDPAIIAQASPGELFIVRNVANLVPPYESANVGLHGTSAAIEFAVENLKVENVVILGHRQCGGIRALMAGTTKKQDSFVGQWMEMATSAREKVLREMGHEDFENQCRSCELEAIVNSIENLKTFPFVQRALAERDMKIYGIYFDLELGQLKEYDESSRAFRVIEIN
jgi:carbonic anhydrase